MKYILVTAALLYSIVFFGQDHDDLYVLEADSTWLKEIIKFPLSFAQDINYEGYEDLRFAKNWSKPEGSEFFTYAFVWNINLKEVPTVAMIEANMKLYYDGLMGAVNKEKDFTVPKTIVEFNELKSDTDLPKFKGKIQVHDSFFTRKTIELHVTVKTSYCKDQNEYLMLFRVSTLDFDNAIWNQLNAIKLTLDICKK